MSEHVYNYETGKVEPRRAGWPRLYPGHRVVNDDYPHADTWTPIFGERWRHGGWYVTNLHYPSGAIGCVSNNYADKRWRIACDPRPFETAPSFKTRTEAAHAERALVAATT